MAWKIILVLILFSILIIAVYKRLSDPVKNIALFFKNINRELLSKNLRIARLDLLDTIKNKITFREITEFFSKKIIFILNLFLFVFTFFFAEFLPPYIRISLAIYVGFLFVYTITQIPKFLISKKSGFDLISGIFFTFLFTIQLGLTSIVQLLQSYTNNSDFHFKPLFACLVLFMATLLSTIKSIMDSTKNAWVILLSAIFSFVISELFMLFLFGVYNISHEPQFQNDELINSINSQSLPMSIISIIYFGSQNVFSLKNIDITKEFTLIPALEFFIGMIFNILIVGFFISYVSSVIHEFNKSNDSKTDDSSQQTL